MLAAFALAEQSLAHQADVQAVLEAAERAEDQRAATALRNLGQRLDGTRAGGRPTSAFTCNSARQLQRKRLERFYRDAHQVARRSVDLWTRQLRRPQVKRGR